MIFVLVAHLLQECPERSFICNCFRTKQLLYWTNRRWICMTGGIMISINSQVWEAAQKRVNCRFIRTVSYTDEKKKEECGWVIQASTALKRFSVKFISFGLHENILTSSHRYLLRQEKQNLTNKNTVLWVIDLPFIWPPPSTSYKSNTTPFKWFENRTVYFRAVDVRSMRIQDAWEPCSIAVKNNTCRRRHFQLPTSTMISCDRRGDIFFQRMFGGNAY